MPRPALASIDDFESFTGQDVTNTTQIEALLARASEIVRAYAGVTWLNDDESAVVDVPAQIPGEVCDIVDRATRNLDGITQEQAGPFQRSFGPAAAQRMYLTRANKAVIRAAVGRSEIGVISTTRGDMETRHIGVEGVWPEETLTGLHGLLGGS